ncbi:unnamed protein product [Periconia digitata]|uniref:Uncharacterized protein n=1 Tax=Periconia digitata TaxID=1303443 RepID=A0A9W4XL73_9PLEO|nr:unnamed protein product [Periconia digitata]
MPWKLRKCIPGLPQTSHLVFNSMVISRPHRLEVCSTSFPTQLNATINDNDG